MSAALPITPEEVQADPIVGWRIWRVIEADTLDGAKALRLAAAGTRGLPPLWPPLQPIVAVCSKFDSRHEAPWPNHQCGVYALRTRRLAEEVLATFAAAENGDKVEAWAIGRVSLWGRVVECERGWRGQYGYPYALTVLTEDESLARRLTAVYAVDVDTAPPPPVEMSHDDEQEALVAASNTLTSELKPKLAALKTGLAALERLMPVMEPSQPAIQVKPVERKVEQVPCPSISTEVSREDVLTAFYLHAARALKRGASRKGVEQRNLVESGELTLLLLWQRGWPLERLSHAAWKKLPSQADEALRAVGNAVRAELRRMKRDGLAESGLINLSYRQVYYRLTEKGTDAVADVPRLPSRLRTVVEDGPRWDAPLVVKTARVSRPKVLDRMRLRPALFTTEVEALKPQLAAERAAARAKGALAFKRHLARVRGRDEFNEVRIYWTEEEVFLALREAFKMRRRQPVKFQQLMAVLGPGTYGKEEAARVSAMLAKLRKAGKVEVIKAQKSWAKQPSARLWQPARK